MIWIIIFKTINYKNDDFTNDSIPMWRGCHGDSVLVCSPFTVAAGGAAQSAS